MLENLGKTICATQLLEQNSPLQQLTPNTVSSLSGPTPVAGAAFLAAAAHSDIEDVNEKHANYDEKRKVQK